MLDWEAMRKKERKYERMELMKLLILGATGRVGRQVLNNAIKDGHQVTVLVRSKDKLSDLEPGLFEIVEGNVLNASDVEAAMKGAEAVISALSTDGADVLSQGLPLVIGTMKKAGISRIVTVGTAGILQSRVSPDLLRYQSSESRRSLTRASQEHHQAYSLLEASGLDWTIVCPTYLPEGTRVGSYRIEADYLPENATEISVYDTADFAYEQLFSQKHLHTRVGIAY
ncbi:NAD(P)H-binding protein [Brevibacillus invocatus]